MAMWECGRCGANFQDHEELDVHAVEAHGDGVRATRPQLPHSSPVKPLGARAPSPEARDLRTGIGRERVPGGHAKEPHPTRLDGEPQPRQESPHKSTKE